MSRRPARSGFRRSGGSVSAEDAAAGPRLIDTTEEFDELLERLLQAERFALDTEFHREGTYHPEVALVQIATEDEIALVDPLAVDLARMSEVLASDTEVVMHAGRQDLEILHRAAGRVPARWYDTQVAACFVGYSSPSLANLLEREMGIKLPKASRLSDWMRRPLSRTQREYAASDVAYLLPLADGLREQVAERGRTEWVEEAIEEQRTDEWTTRDPARAWLRLREVRHLKGNSLAVAQELARWREETAAQMDIPVRLLLADLGLVGLAQAKPQTVQEIRQTRGVEQRNLRGDLATAALKVIDDNRTSEPQFPVPAAGKELRADMKPAVTLVTTWITQLAKDLALDAPVLGTRADVEALLSGDPQARLSHGWRAEVAGERIQSLVGGTSAVAFSPKDGLILVPRTVTGG